MRGVALNFFPIKSHEFNIVIFRSPYHEARRPERGNEKAKMRQFVVDNERKPYWTLFQHTQGSTKVNCQPNDDIYLTIDSLRLAITTKCRQIFSSEQIRVVGRFSQFVEIDIDVRTEGSRVITLEPYFLRTQKRFGFLVDTRFHPNAEAKGTRQALQLSLSLDKNGRQNLNYYADRYSILTEFATQYFDQFFPLEIPGGDRITVEQKLLELTPNSLDQKNYIVGSSVQSKSQFMGVKTTGPLKKLMDFDNTHLYFIYRREDHALSHELFRALRGDTFRTFPGMEEMFDFPITKDNSHGIALSNFNDDEIQLTVEKVVKDAGGRTVVPVVLTPFCKSDHPNENKVYWRLKHRFLSSMIPIQVVATKTVADRNKLKWSTAGIGLQIFAKAGGKPWKVSPESENCLIVGIGQAHRTTNGQIERYFAYSVLSDSSGEFEEVRIISDEKNEDKYIENFGDSLTKIIEDYSDRFSSCVVHTTFSIRRRELDKISEVLSVQRSQHEMGEFVALKFNDRNRFFGYSIDHNSLVPYESTVVSISRYEHLVWFEGLQYGRKTLQKMVGNPVHVKFTYPTEVLTDKQQRVYLQDAINLSGANWRGFNAKSLPVSVYYAQLIAKYLREFEQQGLPPVDVNTLTPWFL